MQRPPTSKPSELFDNNADSYGGYDVAIDDDKFMQRSVEDLRLRHVELRESLKTAGRRKAVLNVRAHISAEAHLLVNLTSCHTHRMFY